MRKKILGYSAFFLVLILVFLYFVFKDEDLSKSFLPVTNDVQAFSFIDQNRQTITNQNVEGKVYVANYFFTTCKGICPKMNVNMRRVYDVFKNESNFCILSHTCMPETDSTPLLKAYEQKMINGELIKNVDGSYKIKYDSSSLPNKNTNWFFLTGNKTQLYQMARQSYIIDNNKPDSAQNIANQFIHTQFFALVDKNGRVRGKVYDGLVNAEIEELITNIKGLLKEKIQTKRFMNGFSNNPN